MPENVLDKIIRKKIEKIKIIKEQITIDELNHKIEEKKNFIDFKEKIISNIKNKKTSLICEIKKASPSAGIIMEKYNPVDIAKIYYSKKATCLSVLTEEDFFLGNLIHISKIKNEVNLPVLCKDFFVDKFQVPLAKSHGADAVLIILSALSDQQSKEIYQEALNYNMSIIVEVHTIDEAKKLNYFKNAIIGINNRNLKTLDTNLNTTYDIYEIVKDYKNPIVAESGIKSRADIIEIEKKTKIKTFLIGESLLKNMGENSIFSVL
tara:strand:- start:1371 stop:2162 length:792 start_codon:yes stop_codon:yes gene_type:complete